MGFLRDFSGFLRVFLGLLFGFFWVFLQVHFGAEFVGGQPSRVRHRVRLLQSAPRLPGADSALTQRTHEAGGFSESSLSSSSSPVGLITVSVRPAAPGVDLRNCGSHRFPRDHDRAGSSHHTGEGNSVGPTPTQGTQS